MNRSGNKTVGDLFHERPKQWGLRGDSYLWDELLETLADVALPINRDEFENILDAAFRTATGKSLAFLDEINLERFAHGGMSSGGISGKFWREKGFPLIISRFEKSLEREDVKPYDPNEKFGGPSPDPQLSNKLAALAANEKHK